MLLNKILQSESWIEMRSEALNMSIDNVLADRELLKLLAPDKCTRVGLFSERESRLRDVGNDDRQHLMS
jgi:hypothetical protein